MHILDGVHYCLSHFAASFFLLSDQAEAAVSLAYERFLLTQATPSRLVTSTGAHTACVLPPLPLMVITWLMIGFPAKLYASVVTY